MSEKGVARTGGFEPESSELAALRLQLEGGLEVLEACLARYRELSAALQGWRWKTELRQSPALLQNALRAESSVHEVLARLQRRAGQEPDGQGPASRLGRKVEEERTALSKLIARRLSVALEGSLAERLGRLEAVALKPLPLPPGEGETLLLEGGARWPPVRHFVYCFVLWQISSVVLRIAEALQKLSVPQGGAWVAVPLLLLFYVWFYVRSGHYWLTSERLLWKPRLGEPVEVKLSSLGDGQVTLGSSSTVKVRGRSRVTLRYVPQAWRLASLISIYRRQAFRGVARREPPPLMVILEMYRTRPGETPNTENVSGGLAVLRPGFVVYFPHVLYSKLLDTLTGPTEPSRAPTKHSRDKVDVPDSLVLTQLQLLPEERLDALLRKAHLANPKSVLWESRDLKWNFGSSSVLELVRGDEALWSSLPSWAAYQHVGRVLQSWRAAFLANPPGSR